MALPNYTIKPMTRRDLNRAIDWAAAEGWNPGLHDADCSYTADPNGFFMGWLGDQPVAAISAVKYGDTFGFVGFYLVRPAFLKDWLTQPDSLAVGFLHRQKLVGYSLIRTCWEGYKIGPLFADTAQIAEAIFLSLGAYISADSVFYLDVPGINPQAVALAEKYQMTPVFETARMYRREAPELPLARSFGITTFELG